MSKIFVFSGSILAFLAVALGAFGSHGLKPKLSPEMFSIYQTAVQYHMIHAIGIILIGVIAHHITSSGIIQWAGGLLLLGILFFSGSLYLLTLTDIKWVGPVTPVGGLCFLAGWLLLAIAALKNL